MEIVLYLFNNDKELIDTLDDISVHDQKLILNGQITAEVEGKYKSVINKAMYFGATDVDDDGIFWRYRKTKQAINNGRFEVSGIYELFDDLKSRSVIIDKRPTDESAASTLTTLLQGTGWQVGTVSTANTGSANWYYETPLNAFWEFLDKWNVEFKPRMTFSKGKVTGKYIDIADNISADYGKWYERGDKLLTVVAEERHDEIFTAFYGRGKGEEVGDGFGRGINFADVEWGKDKPLLKPGGQEYLEFPSATAKYGYEDGTPRFDVVVFEDIEDEEELLEATYQYGINEIRPKEQFKATILENETAELGEIVTIIDDQSDIRYKTKIFELVRNFLNGDVKDVELGDKLVKTRAEQTKNVENTIKKQEEQTMDWLNLIRDSVINDYFNEDGYDYDLKVGNKYDLPAGRYSFDRPMSENPTKVVYMGAGKVLLANSKLPSGEWDWRTAIDGDGVNADVVNTGTLNANLIRAGVLQDVTGTTVFDLANGNLTINVDDGSYIRMNQDGIKRYTSTDERNYHYLFHATAFVYGSSAPNSTRWMQLPDDFKGKDFQVYLSIADSMNAIDYTRSIQRIVATGHPNYSIDYKNARVPIIAYKSETKGDGNAPSITDIQGMLLAIY